MISNKFKKIVVIGSVLLTTLSVQAGLYRWVDDAGNVHFSDKVPAAASKKAHAKLNKTGDVTKTVDPTSIQSDKLSKDLEEKEKLQREELLRIKQEAKDIIQKRDDFLLSTYENEDELKHSFLSKIRMLEGNTKILEAQNTVLGKKVAKLEKKAAITKNKVALKSIKSKVVNINKTIEQYHKALKENDTQISTLNTNYQTDLARFIELTK